jgi:hypothetical protein
MTADASMTEACMTNPFDRHGEPDRHQIWQKLVAIDSDAFIAGDWSMIEDDFDAANFEGIRRAGSANPDDWRIAFADVAAYRDGWLDASRQFLKKPFANLSHRQAIYRRCRLNEIDINGPIALAHKKFSGDIQYADGSVLSGSRQTLYRLRKKDDRWKIVGFLGFLPL